MQETDSMPANHLAYIQILNSDMKTIIMKLTKEEPSTTAKTSFAQSRDFCREQKRGISAKKPFAERGSRQTRAVGNSQDCRGPASRQTTTLGEVGHFAESPARQKMTFGKMGLCRGPHSRQNQALGKTLPWAHRRDLP